MKLYKLGALWNSGIVVVKNSYLKSLFNQFDKKLYSLVKKSFVSSYKEMEFIFLGKKVGIKFLPFHLTMLYLKKNLKK